MHASLVESILHQIRLLGAEIHIDPASSVLTINRMFTASLVLARCKEAHDRSFRWQIRFDTSLRPDITIAARLGAGNYSILDYYLFPGIDVLWERLRLRPDNGVALDSYRFENLNFFENLARTIDVMEAA